MNDKELADKVVALGVGKRDGSFYGINAPLDLATRFVRDWRVAGALIELVTKKGWSIDITVPLVYVLDGTDAMADTISEAVTDDGIPRAIISAYVAALT